MALQLQYVKLPEGDAGHVIATARLCLTEDGRLVPDTDADARWLFCVPGVPIKRADAERYGLLDEPAPELEPEPEPEPEPSAEPPKSRPAPANKSRSRPADK